MKKLSLRPDDLRVESVATQRDSETRGTVRGQQESVDFTQCAEACYSFGGTCGASPPIIEFRAAGAFGTRDFKCCV